MILKLILSSIFLLINSSPTELSFRYRIPAQPPTPQVVVINDDTVPCPIVSIGTYEYDRTDLKWLWAYTNNFSCTDRTPVAIWVVPTFMYVGTYKGVVMVNDLLIPVTLVIQ